MGDCGHRLLRRHFTMADTARLDLPSVQTPGRQRLRANMTYVPTPSVNDFCLTLWEFLLVSLCCFMWGVSLTLLMLFSVRNFSYTPHAVLCGEFLLHSSCCFMWGVSLTLPVLFSVRNFSYTPHAVLCGEFLLHSSCCFMGGVSLTLPVLLSVGVCFTCPVLFWTCGEFLL